MGWGSVSIRRAAEANYVCSGAGKASGWGAARRTLPAAISRRATTIALLSEAKRGFAPFRSCFALFAASITSSKRLGISERQSSTVILAMAVCYLATSRLTRDRHKRSITMAERRSFAACVIAARLARITSYESITRVSALDNIH
jgi:hypothetical protein